MAKAKAPVKNPNETQNQFNPTPYETTNILTSITLLGSVEKNVVIRALSTLTKFADEKQTNSEYLYKNGILTTLMELLEYTDLAILRFTLKLLAQMVTISSEAADELSFGDYKSSVARIAFIFISNQDTIVKEFSSQFLANINNSIISSSLLSLGIISPIFSLLAYSEDPDAQFYTLRLFCNVLDAPEAPTVIPKLPDFSPKLLLDYLRHPVQEIATEAIDIIERLVLWKSDRVQELFRESKIVEGLLKIIFEEGYKNLHKKAFSIIQNSIECPETLNYVVQTLEFLEFCKWAKTCPKKQIRPTATILAAISKANAHLQLLFDFSIEDTILSFFRTENEFVHYQVCVAISNLSRHRYCCQKIVTPVVIKCILRVLLRLNLPLNPYHENAYKTLLDLLKRNEKTMNLIITCNGVELLIDALLRDKDNYSSEGLYDLLYILYIFSSNKEHKLLMMNPSIFEMLLNRYSEHSDYSNLSLLIIDQYMDSGEYRHYYVQYKGPLKIMDAITSTPNEVLLKNTLLHLHNACVYKNICLEFLAGGILKILEQFSDEVQEEIPFVNQLTSTIYNLYLPLKFEKVRRLEVTDYLSRKFYVVKERCKEFPFLEILHKINACTRNIIYVVDFTADASQLTEQFVKQPEVVNESSTVQKKGSFGKMKNGSGLKLNISKSSSQKSLNTLVCKVPPPINYGYLSEDPYLPQYVYELKKKIYEDENHIMCFQHQVKTVAEFVNNVLSGPPYADEKSHQHCLQVHLEALREKLGTNLIPIGFLRYGFHCEKSLLFKALSDKLGIPCALCKGNNDLIYWNEVPVLCNEDYEILEDNVNTYMEYAVVDLMNEIGELMLVGTVKADKYCGINIENQGMMGSSKLTLETILSKI
ncbi:hypothetical protein RI129_013129 [Pyrocoelia pectoralis]|uniref:EDR1/CTR1/ARMC3-like peptidase-like domain-containing protein n=1 Tax=Pyrocoelia pectoralis TaxID=417401 RepID=A0AAN7V7M6_9COLE